MKRLVLRIAALGTVVVLGLIAIAQAQRGSGGSPPAADELPPADTGFSVAEASDAASLGSENRLRTTFPDGPGENPLRAEDRLVEPTEPSPAANLLTADRRKSPAVVSPVAPELSPEIPSADPFVSRADRNDTATGPAAARVVRTAGQSPAVSPLQAMPPQAVSQRAYDSQFSAPLAPAELPNTSPSALGGPEPGPVEPNSGLPPGSAEIGEPGRFTADPEAAPAAAVGSAPELGAPGNFTPLAPTGLASDPLPAGEGTGQPGGKQLEGPQTPQLTIQKSGPPAIQVGKEAAFRVTVRNTGRVPAHQVEVRDQVPKGARLLSTTPRASRGTTGELVWALGTLQPGDESSVEIQLEPTAEGEIGSVATVYFRAEASARSVVTRPQLVLRTSGPTQVLSGEEVTLSIEVSNPGSGVATGVVIEERVPPGLQHPAGAELEYQIGDVPPGESRKLELTLVANQPGPVANLLTARGDGNLKAEDRLALEVISPQLEVALSGPKRRYLEREATYQMSIHNPGTAPAREVELVAYLPEGLKFVSANNSGHYEEATRTVHWRLEELPTKAVGTVEMVTLPIEAGEQTIRLRGTADRGVSADGAQAVQVDGIAAIKFLVADVTDPIEVGGETTYEVRVVNQGSKAATNVRLAVLLPAEMRAVAAEGPTRHTLQGGRVLFEGLPRLAPKADVTYRVRVQGLKPGDLRVCAQLLTDDMQTPVVKEGSTQVYADE